MIISLMEKTNIVLKSLKLINIVNEEEFIIKENEYGTGGL